MANGILHCVNCVGLHPDESVTRKEIYNRLVNNQKNIFLKLKGFERKKLTQYANKTCILCGRSYDKKGDLDDTWISTAKLVKKEFDGAGLYGIPDYKINEVVASCRKAFIYLMNNKQFMNFEQMERFTFVGRLTLIITHAIEARKSKIGNSSIKTGL